MLVFPDSKRIVYHRLVPKGFSYGMLVTWIIYTEYYLAILITIDIGGMRRINMDFTVWRAPFCQKYSVFTYILFLPPEQSSID